MKTTFLAALSAAALSTTGVLAADTPLAGIAAGDYVMDKTHGYVTFSYSHLGFSNPVLRFDDVDASVTLDNKDPAKSTLMVTIDPASINSGVEKFDGHLVSSDMFDVEKHDTITFKSTSIEIGDDNMGTLTGDLMIKGITKPVTLDVTLNKAGEHPFAKKDTFGISATGTIDRTEWDLSYATPAVGAKVDLVIEAEFNKAD